jgi:hypothetical protein
MNMLLQKENRYAWLCEIDKEKKDIGTTYIYDTGGSEFFHIIVKTERQNTI